MGDMMERTRDKVLGTLYGQAVGDAFGMPTELWPVETLRTVFATPVTDFKAGPRTNSIAKNYQRGQYTDDTGQALALLDGLITTNWVPNQAELARQLIDWATAADAWDQNILGPSSKAALLALKDGRDVQQITDQAVTNGAAMRIAPLGALFTPPQLDDLVRLVTRVTRTTHSSDVAFGGACLIAASVTAAMADYAWDDLVSYALRACHLGYQLGAPTWAAKLPARVNLALDLARRYRGDAARFSQAIYEVVGTGTALTESVPAALAIAYYTRDVQDCAIMCANLGGDTDTIGAMATAICGAKTGVAAFPDGWCRLIDRQNPEHDLRVYAQQILQY